jgi:four helix bundle protein
MDKVTFVEGLKERTKIFAINVIYFYNKLEKNDSVRIVGRQLIRSVTSVAANYRAACLARSKKEFFAKMSIVVEEADETNFWLEIIKEIKISPEIGMYILIEEGLEIVKIMSKARANIFKN